VALPRRERSTGPGHRDFAVDFGPEVSITDDAMRREFTINALCLQLSEDRIIAPEQALEDLRAGIIRAISDSSFDDDPLRMLRAAQFASRLDFMIEPHPFAQMKHKASAILHCSPERVRDELAKLIEKSPRPSLGMNLLRDSGLLLYILPELAEAVGVVQNRYHSFDVWDHVMAALDASAYAGHDLVTRMSVLLHDVAKPRTAEPRADRQGNTFYGHEIVGADMTVEILRRLRFSEDFVETVRLAVREHMYVTRESNRTELPDAALRRFIRRVGPDNVERQFAVRHEDVRGRTVKPAGGSAHNEAFEQRVRALLRQGTPLSLKEMAISGEDLIRILINHGVHRAGYRGKDVGHILERLLETVIENSDNGRREILLARCEHLVREIGLAGR
jgi:tRNA nucleotidyltransferase (CCA-adding enzyme)